MTHSNQLLLKPSMQIMCTDSLGSREIALCDWLII